MSSVSFNDTNGHGGAFYSAAVWGYRRWPLARGGTWTVCVGLPDATGVGCVVVPAVVDDFGNLVQVPA